MTKFTKSRPSFGVSPVTNLFAPRNSRLALETRILFDGAAAVAGADAFDGETGGAPEHVPQSQDDQRDAVMESLFGEGDLAPMADMAALDAPTSGVDPAVTLGAPDGGAEVMIGEDFTFTVSFSNAGDTTGFGPYIDLYLPKGIDGDDGININSSGAIKYLGQAIDSYTVVTLDSEGKADHPFAVESDGTGRVITGEAGQKVVVIELPFGSYTHGQPAAEIEVTATLHEYADVGENLTIRAVSGFRYGDTALGENGSIVLETEATLDITPTVIKYEHVFNGPENETATGEHFERDVTTTVTVAPGHEVTDHVLTFDVPSNIVVTRVNGESIDDAVSSGKLTVEDGRLSYKLGKISGETEFRFSYYVPELVSDDIHVLDPNLGLAGNVAFQIAGTGNWTPKDPRDLPEGEDKIELVYAPPTVEVTHSIRSLAVQKYVEVKGGGDPKPGAQLDYQLNFQVSDYFQFKDIVIVDVIDDGHTPGEPTFLLTYNGETYTIPLKMAELSSTLMLLMLLPATSPARSKFLKQLPLRLGYRQLSPTDC